MNHVKTAILLIHCPDKPGIVHAVTGFLLKHGGNILYLDQHVDHVEQIFFMRVEWSFENFSIPEPEIDEQFKAACALQYDMSYRLFFSDYVPKMAIFVSKLSHCLYDLLARYAGGEWNVHIPLIISNHPDMKKVADMFGIPYYYFPVNKDTRDELAPEILELLRANEVDFIVLARYMQIVPDLLIDAYPNRIINIHHSFLPAFVGAKPYHAAYERGVKLIGATSHYVTSVLDAGPIIGQDIARISHKNSVDDLIRKGKDLEKIVLSRAVEKHLSHKILAYKNKTIIFS